MKELKSIFLFLLLTIFGCETDDTTDLAENSKEYIELSEDKYNAVELNNQVSNIQKGALALVDSVFRADTSSISKKTEDAIFDLDVNLNKLKSLGDEHEVAKYFANSVSQLLTFYKTEFENDFKDLIPILKKAKLNDEDRAILDSYDKEFVNQEANLFNEIVICQDSFTNFFKIKLTN